LHDGRSYSSKRQAQKGVVELRLKLQKCPPSSLMSSNRYIVEELNLNGQPSPVFSSGVELTKKIVLTVDEVKELLTIPHLSIEILGVVGESLGTIEKDNAG